MTQTRIRIYFLLASSLWLCILSGCRGLKSSSCGPGRHLFTGYSVKIDSSALMQKPRDARVELEDLISEKPNRRLLWMRPALCLHNLLPEPKNDSGFWHWMKYKLGAPPVLFEEMNLPNLARAMENRLQNRGHFLAKATFEVDSGKKTAQVKFMIAPGRPYRIRSVQYPPAADGINGAIHDLQQNSILKPGNIYTLNDFENERLRIDSSLKEIGYFYFNADYLLFIADTVAGPGELKVWLKLKSDIPPEAILPFRFSDIYVADDYSLQEYHPDTVMTNTVHYVSENHLFRPETILHCVFLEKDSLYARSDYFKTIRHTMDLGVFKFATARFARNGLEQSMTASVLLTPFKKISLSAEMNANIKSTGFAGPGLKLTYRNRNTLQGAELFAITLGGNFETQIKGDTKGQTSFQVTLDASLTVPKFVPFRFGKKDNRSAFPKTIFTAGIGVYSRVNLYDLRSFNTSVGYSWRTGEKISHLFRPLDISYTNLANATAEFDEYLEENPNVKKSFEEQFILGASYTFIYSDFTRRKRRSSFYLSESVDVSGNIANTVASIGEGASDAGKQHEFLGVPFSQFIRLRNEERYFYNLTASSQLGARLILGAGIPYKNSTTMPYNRQYFAGGTSSIRAFLSRSLGPGTYQIPDSLKDVAIDQAGDITLETSLEYRFNIIKNFKGALFTDAGNIWLVNEDTTRLGGKFDINTFYKEIAVGAGFGFRFDFNFIILRFDLAMPLRKPWLPEGERWVLDKIALGSSSWRKENLVLNVAIGYPF